MKILVGALAADAGSVTRSRVLAGMFMFAVIYLVIGALASVVVASPVNGTVLIFFVWITTSCSARSSAPFLPGRLGVPDPLPDHVDDRPASHHAGRVGDPGLGADLDARRRDRGLGGADLGVAHRPRPQGRSSRRHGRSGPGRAIDWGRNRVLWVLLAAVLTVLIVLATRAGPGSQRLRQPRRL
jgi:hypothetical protein